MMDVLISRLNHDSKFGEVFHDMAIIRIRDENFEDFKKLINKLGYQILIRGNLYFQEYQDYYERKDLLLFFDELELMRTYINNDYDPEETKLVKRYMKHNLT